MDANTRVPASPFPRWRRFLTDLGCGAAFGGLTGTAELHATYLTAGAFNLAAMLAVLLYDALAFAVAGALIGLRHWAGPAVVRVCSPIPWMLGLLLAVRCGVTGLYVVFRYDTDSLTNLALRIGAPCAVGALLLALACRRLTRGAAGRSGVAGSMLAAVLALVYAEYLWRQLVSIAVAELRFLVLVVATAAAAWLALWLVGRARPAARLPWVAAVLLLLIVGRAWSGPPGFADIRQTFAAEDGEAPGGARPDVILIVLDTLRADHMELYGYPRETMPELTRFARQATVYRDCIANSSWTLPAHATLFTGLHVRAHGARGGSAQSENPGRWGSHPLTEDKITLAEVLRTAGYRTAGVVANYMYVTAEQGLSQGFDHWDARPGFLGAALIGYAPLVLQTRALVDALPVRWIYEPLVFFDVAQVQYRRAEQVRDQVLRLLDGPLTREGRPFFLFVNFMDPHDPYQPPRPFADRFPGRLRGAPRHWKGLSRHRGRLSDAELQRHLASQYDADLAYLDSQLGTLFDELERRDLLRDALVVVTSDHGEALLEHGQYHHGQSLYQEEIAIPMIVHDPARPKSEIVEGATELRAVMPWLLTRLAIELPPGLERREHLESDQPRVAELYGSRGVGRGVAADAHNDITMINDDGLKHLRNSAGRPELYDLRHDPAEREDLSERLADRLLALDQRLAEWAAAVRASDVVPAKPLTAEEVERLRSLGYVN